jgi:PAS domain S-box-containing protein
MKRQSTAFKPGDRQRATVPVPVKSFAIVEPGGHRRSTDQISVTDREHSRRQLERLGAAVDQTVDGVVVADGQGVIVYVNRAYEKQSGRAAVELVGTDATTIIGEILGDRVRESMVRAARGGLPWVGEVEQRRSDSSTSLVEMSMTPLREPSGATSGFVAFQRDVTYMRTMEGDLVLEAQMRGVLGGALHLIPAKSTLEEAAQAVCNGLCSIPGVDFRIGGSVPRSR